MCAGIFQNIFTVNPKNVIIYFFYLSIFLVTVGVLGVKWRRAKKIWLSVRLTLSQMRGQYGTTNIAVSCICMTHLT